MTTIEIQKRDEQTSANFQNQAAGRGESTLAAAAREMQRRGRTVNTRMHSNINKPNADGGRAIYGWN